MTWMAELRRRGYKATPQRALILKVLEESRQHMTAEEIGRAVEAQAVPLNRSTVYRTVETLATLGIIRATRIGRSTHYEIAGDDQEHHHIVCTNCRATIDLPMGGAAAELTTLARKSGYEVTSIEVLVTGLCSDCRATRTQTSSVTG
jgi:Fur family ferric uptake transcriptional regulator